MWDKQSNDKTRGVDGGENEGKGSDGEMERVVREEIKVKRIRVMGEVEMKRKSDGKGWDKESDDRGRDGEIKTDDKGRDEDGWLKER